MELARRDDDFDNSTFVQLFLHYFFFSFSFFAKLCLESFEIEACV